MRDDLTPAIGGLVGGSSDVLERLAIAPDDVRGRAVEYAARANAERPAVVAAVAVAASIHDICLERGADERTALATVMTVMTDPWASEALRTRWISRRYGVEPTQPESAWNEAAVKFKERGELVFGRDMEYEQERLDEHVSWVNVTRCGIKDVMSDFGKPELTAVFCALDGLVAREFESRPEYEIKFEQASTMASGSDKCRFRFTRTTGVDLRRRRA